MASIAELLVKISADSSDLQKEIKATQRQMRTAFGSAGLGLASDAVTIMEGLGVSFAAAGAEAVKLAGNMEQMQTAFSTLLGGADAGQKMTNSLVALADVTPFTTQELGAAARQMLAYGFAAKDVPGLLVNVGNASSALGLGAEGVQRITMALGQMGAAGQVHAQDMMQLTSAGVSAWKMLADATGMSVAQVKDASEKGMIDAATGINAILKGMNDRFAGGMEAQAKTMLGAWSNFKDGFENMMAGIGGKVASGLNLTSMFTGSGQWMASFAASLQQVKDDEGNVTREALTLSEAMKQFIPPEAIAAVTVLGGILTAVAIPALVGMASAAVLALAPFAELIAVGVLLGAAAFEIYNNWGSLGSLFTQIFDLIGVLAEGAVDFVVWNFTEGADKVGEVFTLMSDVVSGVFDFIGGLAEFIWNALSEGVSGFGNVCSSVWSAVAGFFQEHFSGIYSFGVSIFNSLSNVVGEFANWVAQKLSGVLSFASKVYNAVAGVIGAVQNANWGNVKLGFDFPDLGSTVASFLPSRSVAPVTNADMSNFGAGDPKAAKEKAGKKGKKEPKSQEEKDAEKAYKKEISDANNFAKKLNKDYKKMFDEKTVISKIAHQQDLDDLEKWHNDGLVSDEDFEKDKIKLQRKYTIDLMVEAQKQQDITRGYAKDAKSLFDSLLDLQDTNLTGAAAAAESFQRAWKKALSDVDDKVDDLVSKLNTISNPDERSAKAKAYGLADKPEGQAYTREDLAKVYTDKAKAAINKLYTDTKAMDNAYNQGHIAEYQSMLDKESNLEAKKISGQKAYMDELKDLWNKTNHTIYDDTATLMSDVSSDLTSVFEKFAHGTASAIDVFHSFAQSVIDSIIKIQAQAAAASITSSLGNIFGAVTGGSSGYDMSFGIGSAAALFKADGGMISGPGTGTSDSILSWLSAGEHVMKASSVSSIGPSNLEYMNRTGKLPGFATGGLVTGPSLSSMSSYSGATVQSGGQVNVSGSGGVSVIVNNNGQPVTATAKDNGINSAGVREIIVDLATEGVLNKLASNRSYANNVKMAMG
ncbi:lambda family phage tail tape measure protein [Sporomusaceae bacterium BoRhaA]|uniref:tape measure protein n=1 Tax=Pelorhabdus rhamnosifermentans TaxID=2772457 RepID=UPI001C063D12|nr:tape measure protein [Pelorhabdus rhamnosifermentans]MBU2703873.1 lambda family phage tail tape measure protein [Pelorhabdus rhamnosifermentans]